MIENTKSNMLSTAHIEYGMASITIHTYFILLPPYSAFAQYAPRLERNSTTKIESIITSHVDNKNI